jgi:hypothetical protein
LILLQPKQKKNIIQKINIMIADRKANYTLNDN